MVVSLLPQRISIRHKVLLGFGLVLAMLATIAMITWRSTRGFMQTAALVARSHEVLAKSDRLLRFLMEMESGRRGFLITGDDRYLRGYEQAQADIIDTLIGLRTDTVETPEQGERLEELKQLISQSFALQGSEIEARRTRGFAPAVGLFQAAESEEVTYKIRSVLDDIAERESMVLEERERLSDEIGTETTIIIFVGTAVTLVALIVAGGMILRDIAARRRAEESLADQHNLLSSILDTIPDNLFVKDVKGRYIMDNRAHRNFLELEDGESIEGKTVFDFYPKNLAAIYDASDEEVFAHGKSVRNREEPAITRSGNEVWLSTTKVPLREPDGRMLGLVCVSADVTERKDAEEKLRRFAGQLERSNAELANFASVASHDLQEPLRKIQAFGDRLRAKYATVLGAGGLDYLERMQSAAERMRVLIQDLLKLSRVTSRAQPFERCDLNAIVREVLSDLEVAIEQKTARIEVGTLPAIDADPLQMRQLFQNLISNAIKFQRPGEVPEVDIDGKVLQATDHRLAGAGPGEEICQIMVKDNGIGFDQKFGDQIFVVFQRLHSRTDFEGTGIGLAVCRKITDRHGGAIVAKSSEGEGATFIITLPVHQPSHLTHEK